MKNKEAEKTKIGLSRPDLAIVSLASVVLLFFLYTILIDDSIFDSSQDNRGKAGKVIGSILAMNNDTRHRKFEEFAWKKALLNDTIQNGDSLFTGTESTAQVSLKDGNQISLGENTLVAFQDFGEKDPLANLASGNFRLKIDGTMKLAIQGEVTEISGDGSELQVVIDKKEKPKIKILKGKPSLKPKSSRAFVALSPNTFTSLNINPSKVSFDEPVLNSQIFEASNEKEYIHTYRIEDLYNETPAGLTLRPEKRIYVKRPVQLSWKSQGEAAKIYGEHSLTGSYDKSVFNFQSPAETNKVSFEKAYVGDNYWRLSFDKKNWTEMPSFKIVPKFLVAPTPQVRFKGQEFFLLSDRLIVNADITKTDSNLKGAIVEISDDKTFPADRTQAHVHSVNFSWTITQPGRYFIRTRGLNNLDEITESSSSQQITIVQPAMPSMPRLTSKDIQVQAGERALLSWQEAPNIKSYTIQIKNDEGKVIESQHTVSHDFVWKSHKKIGHYKVKITAQDKWDRINIKSAEATLTVTPRIEKILAKQSPPRSVASTDPQLAPSNQSQATFKPEQPGFYNLYFDYSKLDLEGANFVNYSSKQIQAQSAAEQGFNLGVKTTHWIQMGANGVEGHLQKKSSANGDSSLSVEARYLRRFTFPWNPLSDVKRIQTSFILGYENYRNSNRAYFSPGYDIAKGGLSFNLPFLSRFEGGGEFLLGFASDKSYKYEVGGHLDYYITQKWSLGVGYKFHVFEAISTASVPSKVTLPFREVDGEAFSVLGWRY